MDKTKTKKNTYTKQTNWKLSAIREKKTSCSSHTL
jgi:hypothetical protein